MQKKWVIKNPEVEIVQNLANSLCIDKIICQVLANRGIKTQKEAERFLNPCLDGLHNPLSLKDMDKAVLRIKKAVASKENILIFTDYDVDGITSCAILEKELKKLGAKVLHYIPHRVKEGYGLNLNAVSTALKHNVKLLIALDCGISSFKEVEAFGRHNIDTIIVDHHQPQDGALPKAYAIVNPKRKDCSYEFKNLAAVGLVYKLICALEDDAKDKYKDKYLDLVSLGTIADVVPLVDENRIIVKKGLESMNKSPSLSIKALAQASGLKDKEINPGRVSFILAPRINASGRVASAEASLDLLLSDDYLTAQELAKNLNVHNRQRQKIEEGVLKEAISFADKINFKDTNIIVLYKQDWHVGVLGIVASKIADKYLRPAIIISLKDGLGKGSGRSVAGFHLFDTLLCCSKHLKNFGGHSHAVGLSIEEEKIEDFIKDINKAACEKIELDTFRPVLDIDAQLPLSFLNEEIIKQIQVLGPFGLGNSRPVFCSHNLTVKSPAAILGFDTIKFWVSDGECTFQAIGFGLRDAASYITVNRKIDLAYNLSLDNWQDINSILLEVKDLRIIA